MIKIEAGKWIFSPHHCRQCGICAAVCPKQAISFRYKADTFTVACDAAKCVGCGICAEVCSAGGADTANTGADAAGARLILRAWAADPAVRRIASSGGVARSLIREVLNTRRCDAVYTLLRPAVGVEARGGWLTTYPEDEHVLPTSLYRPVPWGEHLSPVNPEWKSLLLVGLPCQLRAARRYLHRKLPQAEILCVTILCKKQKTLGYSRYLLRKLGAPGNALNRLRYRGDGWPGRIRLEDDDGRGEAFCYPAWCWNLPGCRYCLDSLNRQNSDLTLCDPWDLIPQGPDEAGQNLVFVWTPAGVELMRSSRIVQGPEVAANVAADTIPISALRDKAAALQSVRPWSAVWWRRVRCALKKRLGEMYLFLKAGVH